MYTYTYTLVHLKRRHMYTCIRTSSTYYYILQHNTPQFSTLHQQTVHVNWHHVNIRQKCHHTATHCHVMQHTKKHFKRQATHTTSGIYSQKSHPSIYANKPCISAKAPNISTKEPDHCHIIRRRAICFCNEPCICDESFVSLPKSPVFLEKSPVFPGKSPQFAYTALHVCQRAL